VPALTSTYKYMYTCDQVKYSDNTYTWTSVVLDNAITNLTQRMTQAELDLQPDSITAKVASTDTFTTIEQFNNLEIGGRNILLNTSSKQANIDKMRMTYATFVTEDDKSVFKLTGNNALHIFNNTGVWDCMSEKLKANTTYTYSAWIKVSGSGAVNFNFNSFGHFNVSNANSTASDKTHEDVVNARIYRPSTFNKGEWTKISITFTTNALDGSAFGVYPIYNTGASTIAYMYGFKLEEGNRATDWSPAPEDAADFVAIGGENILTGTNQGTNRWYQVVGSKWKQATLENVSWLGVNALKVTSNGVNDSSSTSTYHVLYYSRSGGFAQYLDADEEYTISFDSTYKHTSIRLQQTNASNNIVNTKGAITLSATQKTDVNGQTYWHLVGTFKTKADLTQISSIGNTVVYIDNIPYFETAGNVYKYANLKLEKGNKDTSWTPSPDDLNATAQGYANTAQTSAVNTAKSYTDAQLQITSSSILSTVEQGYTTKTEFSNLQIGGENRFAMSELLPSSKWTFESSTGAGTGIASISGLNARIYQLPSNGYWEWKSNTDYTISIEAKDTGSGNKLRIHAVGLGASYWKEYELTSDWKRYVLTVTAPSTGIVANGSISFYCASSGSIQVRKPKVEYGNRVTDWSPASEDMSSKSEVQQLSNMVAVKVNSSGRLVTAALGVDPASATSYFKVKADDIDIISNGNIQLTGKSIGITSTNFSVTASGSITAKAGTIGGWSIDSEKLYKSGTVSGTTYASYLKANELKISAGLSTLTELEQTVIRSGYIQLIGQAGNPMKNIIIDGAGEESPGTGIGYIQTPRLVTSLIEPQVDNEINIAGALLCNSNKNCYVIGALQLGSASSSLNCGIDIFGGGNPYIDFHLNHSSADFTARIVHRAVSNTNYIDFIASSSTWIDCRAKSFANQSSKYVKDNIKDISDEEAKKILELRPVSFDYKYGGDPDQRGLIAEEVYDILPNMVIGAPKEFNAEEPWDTPSIDYSKFVPYLIKMIQVQQREIDILKSK
ncbi:MAG: tail fiber domain-containing protein, partial [Pseudobutyrivibrio sp.]|nr:tail fiber domain-containing protein [Pseudobutyrivibrio sp.]